jgi:raffinose/stachyose/melibiose transport system permease protein
LFLSFFKWNGISPHKQFVGFHNYHYLFANDSVFAIALRNNIIWMVLFLLIPVTVGLFMALVLNRYFKGRVVYRGLFYFPYILSNIIVAVIWQWMYYPQQGFFDQFLKLFGMSHDGAGWMGNPHTAIYTVVLAAAWQGAGAPMVLFLAGLQAIPQESYEAAMIEGASKFQTLLYVTIPLLKETFVVVISTTMVGALRVFDIVYAMTSGGPAESTEVLATWMYKETYTFNHLGLGSAIAVVMVVLIAVVTIPYITAASREQIV